MRRMLELLHATVDQATTARPQRLGTPRDHSAAATAATAAAAGRHLQAVALQKAVDLFHLGIKLQQALLSMSTSNLGSSGFGRMPSMLASASSGETFGSSGASSSEPGATGGDGGGGIR
eukprot:CAMPEP_0115169970 /NCGR_PEP_ID=MMETSP0270-20121206/1541_2 /TAXON_ID=71861 /ORGANISM="Scrippsiella trochoidea, Strain CCMP3099" /LENGTH=118 /DNA_ID=CAMNT_0002582681 /DNA_START=468 /DNA_END=822 /DNA_ORIENTATION=-